MLTFDLRVKVRYNHVEDHKTQDETANLKIFIVRASELSPALCALHRRLSLRFHWGHLIFLLLVRCVNRLFICVCCQLLAGLLYLQSPTGVHFIDTRDRSHSLSVDSAIWDVPLVKPRFGCSIDLDLSLQGYDVAHQLGEYIDAFRNGTRCERGVMEVDQAMLELKAEWEFPSGYPTTRMPPLRDFRISVMYRTFSGDMELFNASLSRP